MKHVLRNFFSSLPLAAKIYALILALVFPVAWVGHHAGLFELYDWFDLVPTLVWKGQIWRVVTYAFLPPGPLMWVINLFWFATLIALLARNWSSGLNFWIYNFVGAFGGALPFLIFMPKMETGIIGSAAMLFALIVAWDQLYRHEQLILLGFGEISVRQAAILITVINSLIAFFCLGWFGVLSMWCGGVAGWIYLAIGKKRVMSRGSQIAESQRMAKLEL